VETTLFTSDDGTVSFLHPTEDPATGDLWIVIDIKQGNINGVIITNSDRALEAATQSRAPRSGQMWMAMAVIDAPARLTNANVITVLRSFAGATSQNATLTKGVLYPLDNGRVTAYIDAPRLNQRYILTDLEDGRIAALVVTAPIREMDSFMWQIKIILESLE
jgi:hypothetical protein